MIASFCYVNDRTRFVYRLIRLGATSRMMILRIDRNIDSDNTQIVYDMDSKSGLIIQFKITTNKTNGYYCL